MHRNPGPASSFLGVHRRAGCALLLACVAQAQADQPQDAPQAGAWSIVGRQGVIKIVIVPTESARDRQAYDREIAAICEPDQSCFINFYSNTSNAALSLPLPDAIADEATAIFRRSVKQAGEFFRWSCRRGLPGSDCF